MNKIRVISRLDIKGSIPLKGIHLKVFCKMGRPEYLARHSYEHNNLPLIITRAAEEVCIPFTAGDWLRSIEDINNALKVRINKASINTAVVKNPAFINTTVANAFIVAHGGTAFPEEILNIFEKSGVSAVASVLILRYTHIRERGR